MRVCGQNKDLKLKRGRLPLALRKEGQKRSIVGGISFMDKNAKQNMYKNLQIFKNELLLL